MNGISAIPGLKLFGLKDPESTGLGKRTPTFALRLDSLKTAEELAEKLIDAKIICGAGHFYAKYFAEGLGLLPTGGYVRIGFAHYNSEEEIDKVVETLAKISSECWIFCILE